jgi:hypothetical protein
MSKPLKGLNIGGSGALPAPAMGGIGGAMAQAASSTHFNHKPPVSAPRLDSFKMIKVIGKGSFGMLISGLYLICCFVVGIFLIPCAKLYYFVLSP